MDFPIIPPSNRVTVNITNKEVASMKIEVKCNVENCKYWAEGDECVADSIFVIGEHGRTADNEEETACKTFEKRE
jgi:hypothetical protein